jgi:hypothetical protein
MIAFKLIGRSSDTRQTRAIFSSDPAEIVASIIPFIGMMLILFLVYMTCPPITGYIFRMLYCQGIPLEQLGVGPTSLEDPRRTWRVFAENY